MPSVQCPGCNRSINLELHEIGQTIVCAKCDTTFNTLTGETLQSEWLQEVQVPTATPEPTVQGPHDVGFYGQRVVDEHIREIEDTLLMQGEVIRLAITGFVMDLAKQPDPMGKPAGLAPTKGSAFRRHYLIATDQRVILWARGLIVGSATESFHLADLQDVEFRRSLWSGTVLVLSLPAKQAALACVHPDEGRAARDLLVKWAGEARHPKAPPQHGADPTAQLERLAKLYRDGLISKKEFEEKKRKLLDQI